MTEDTFKMEVVQRLTRIETLLQEKPCIKHADEITNINKKIWFFSGMATVISFIINFVFKGN